MKMLIRVGAVNGLRVVQVGVEIQDFRFPMIDPNHGMKVSAHAATIACMRHGLALRQMTWNQHVTGRNVRYRTERNGRHPEPRTMA